MPVVYNCSVCRRRLSISRRKIGENVECPFCSSYTVVPGQDEASLPKVEFAEVKEEPAAGPADDDQESSIQFAPDVTGDLDETQIPQESETPIDERRIHFDEDTDDAGERDEAIVVDPMWTRPAAEGQAAEAPIRFRRVSDEIEEMDLTPMVDVTFLLLIFFMITASFTLEKTIPTPVPDPNDQSAAQPIQQQDDLLDKSILIGIEADNTITIDDEPLRNREELGNILVDLMREQQKAEALVTVSDLAMQETVVYVLDTANDVKMQRIRLATAPAEEN